MQLHRIIEFVEPTASSTIKTKFGGQPDWIGQPQWPISAELGKPMRFICQVHLGDVFPEHTGKLAYIFMTEEDEYADGTWEPDGGENAVIVQPQGEVDVPVEPLETGPSREEFDIAIVEKEIDEDSLEGCRIGGEPEFMQVEECPGPKGEWRYFIQLDSCSLPFEINFGDAGIAYAFINNTASKGKFLWQCS